jgi:hypothetical protein
LTGDLVRGGLVTLGGMLAFGWLTGEIARRWATDGRDTRAAVVAVVAAVAAGAIWKIFHSVPKARLLFVGGLVIGAFLVVNR